MDLRVPEDEDTDFLIEVKRVIFQARKKIIMCANDRVDAIPDIYGLVYGNLHINAD